MGIDQFQHLSEDPIKAGALLAYGVVNSGVRMEGDPVISLLSDDDVLQHGKPSMRLAAIMGLGLSYAGSNREDLLDYLLPIVEDQNLDMQVSAMAAVSLGMVFVGSSNYQVAEAIANQLMDEDRQRQLKDKWARFMALGLALLYFGKQEEADVILDILKAIDHPMAMPTATLTSVCAWAGTWAVSDRHGRGRWPRYGTPTIWSPHALWRVQYSKSCSTRNGSPQPQQSSDEDLRHLVTIQPRQ